MDTSNALKAKTSLTFSESVPSSVFMTSQQNFTLLDFQNEEENSSPHLRICDVKENINLGRTISAEIQQKIIITTNCTCRMHR